MTKLSAAIALLTTQLTAFAFADAQGDLTDAVRAAIETAAPAVVRIETFGGLEKVGDVLVSSGPSTGLVLSEDGFVLCSAYSFAQQPTSVLVTLPSGKRAAAKVIARDESRMLVLLKVNSEETLTPPQLASKSDMQVGQTAIALGRTFDAKTPNVSVGILSATNRIWGKAIQTDAKISPSNYGGPLIDLHGRVLGILVPMSPQGEGALAGSEWYDSGIGFAVPLSEITTQLEKLKQGQNLQAGKLGVSLAGKDDFSQPVEIAAVQPGSPAAKAGLAKGDVVQKVGGKQIRWLGQLKHALGPRYAGETVEVVVKRGDDLVTADVTLAGEIPPYDVPFLGVLPVRTFDGEGVKVRYVYPASPAAKAGIVFGDVIVGTAEKNVANADQLRTLVGTHDVKEGALKLKFEHDGKTRAVEVELASLPTDIPAELPSPREGKPGDAEIPPTGLLEIELPEIANDCYTFVPETYHPDVPHGVVIWLHAPGKFNKDSIEATWREVCQKHDFVLVAPVAAADDTWQPTEAEFVRKALDHVTDAYNVDDTRIVTGGYQAGGTFAALVALGNIEVIRGVALVDAAPPARVAMPSSDPLLRFAFFISTAKESEVNERIDAAAKRLTENKLPVTRHNLGGQPAPWSEAQRSEFARWVDALDRI